MLGQDDAQGAPTVLLTHVRVEVGGGLVLWMRLQAAPAHEETVAQATEHAHQGDAAGTANPAALYGADDCSFGFP